MSTIFDAIRSENLEAIKNFLDKDTTLINSKDQRGSTPLLLSTYYGLKDVTELLLSYNPDVNVQDGSGNTALMGVCFKGYHDIAELLIKAGADMNIKNYNETTALIFSATFGHKDIIVLLVKNGADISAKDNRGYTAEMHAKDQGVDFLELLNLTKS